MYGICTQYIINIEVDISILLMILIRTISSIEFKR